MQNVFKIFAFFTQLLRVARSCGNGPEGSVLFVGVRGTQPVTGSGVIGGHVGGLAVLLG